MSSQILCPALLKIGMCFGSDKSQNLEILGETLKIIQFQPHCCGQGHLQLDQVAQNLIQPGLEHLQGWGIYRFLGNQCHCLTTFTVKNLLLISNLKFTSFSFCPLLFVPSIVPDDESLSSFHIVPFRYWRVPMGFPHNLCQAEQPQLSQSFHIGEVIQFSQQPCGLLWTCSSISMSFSVLGSPEL